MPSLLPADRAALVTTLTFAAIAVLACAMPVHNDTWWHLRGGMETLAGRSPFVDHFSWTVAGQFFWNHSWLSQVLLYGAFLVGGLPGATALCAAAVVTTWWLIWQQSRGDSIEKALLLAVAITVSTVTWSVRPQVAIVLLPVLLSSVAQSRVLPLMLVMALWANLHAGFAVAAPVFVAGLLAAAIWDRASLPGRFLVALAGGVATLATPLGLTNWREIIASTGRSRANAIIEWQPPDFGGLFLAFWVSGAALAFLLAFRWRHLDTSYLRISAIAACLVFVAATQSMRNVPAFMMLAVPPLSAMLFTRSSERPRLLASSAGGRGLQAVTMAAAAAAVAVLWSRPTEAMGWHPLSAQAVSAITECRPRLFNTYNDGGPIIWFVPSQPVFVDSRQDPYPVTLVQQALRVEHQGVFRELFDRLAINCAVLPPQSPASDALDHHQWRTTYLDERWRVLERTEGRSFSDAK